jgi:hypothetical protein
MYFLDFGRNYFEESLVPKAAILSVMGNLQVYGLGGAKDTSSLLQQLSQM